MEKRKLQRKDFEQLRALRQELVTLDAKIARTPAKEMLGDTYGDYRTGFKITKVIYGESDQRKKDLQARFEKKADELARRIMDTEDALDQIEDPVIRDIFRLYYQDGLTEEAIAERKHYSRQRISQLINDYWNCEED